MDLKISLTDNRAKSLVEMSFSHGTRNLFLFSHGNFFWKLINCTGEIKNIFTVKK